MIGARSLTNQEIEAITGSFSGPTAARDRALFLLGLRTGFRISEMLSLKIAQIAPNGTVGDYAVVERKEMKGKGAGRTVKLQTAAKEALAPWIAQALARWPNEPGTYLFRAWKGRNRPIGRMQAWAIWKRIFRKLGLTGSVSCHSTRKTFAAKMHDRLGRDLMKTQKLMGHKRIDSTAAYIAFKDDDLERAILEDW